MNRRQGLFFHCFFFKGQIFKEFSQGQAITRCQGLFFQGVFLGMNLQGILSRRSLQGSAFRCVKA